MRRDDRGPVRTRLVLSVGAVALAVLGVSMISDGKPDTPGTVTIDPGVSSTKPWQPGPGAEPVTSSAMAAPIPAPSPTAAPPPVDPQNPNYAELGVLPAI